MSGELEQIVSVRVLMTPEAGEPVGALLESIFGTTASVWSEDGSSEAKVTVYLERESVDPAEEASLGQGLDVLRAAGLDVGEGEWAVERVEAGGLVGVVEETFQPDRGGRPVAGETGVGGDRAETWPSGGDIESGDELWDGTPRDNVVLSQAFGGMHAGRRREESARCGHGVGDFGHLGGQAGVWPGGGVGL